MEKENKLTAEQDTTDNKVVELKDDDLETITAGSGTPNNGWDKNSNSKGDAFFVVGPYNNGYDENKQAIKFDFLCGSETHNNG